MAKSERELEFAKGEKYPTDAAFDILRKTDPTPAQVAAYGAEKGTIVCLGALITESAQGAGGDYTVDFVIPAGAWLKDIRVTNQALWDDGSGAVMIIGDTADPNGFIESTNMAATALVVGEVMSVMDSALWGGEEGAYVVAATGRRGPQSSNFGQYYAAGSTITVKISVTDGDGTAGRTHVLVEYVIPKKVAQAFA
jgi:hypothetical protein